MATINDVVLIYMEDAPVSFARIESILPDAKKDWYHIKLLMLQIPLQVVTWILKDEYINGLEFQMNGKTMKLQKVECPAEELQPQIPKPEKEPEQSSDTTTSDKQEDATIISFSDFKKNE